MLRNLLRNMLPQNKKREEDAQACHSRGVQHVRNGNIRAAIPEFKRYLELRPHDVQALNDLGYCLSVIGDVDAAAKLFDQAFSLDDTYLPAVINYAKHLVDRQKTTEALPYIIKAKIQDPDFPNVDNVMASACQGVGNISRARLLAKACWLKTFDNLRMANSYLFNCAYDDITELELASEHRFWATTLIERPSSATAQTLDQELTEKYRLAPKSTKRVRIAYWSPDIRNHSVSFFAYPLFRHHNREEFEVILYHDTPLADERTEQARPHIEHFLPVSDLTDAQLRQLMISHNLDILVELAGHTSSNRLNLLQDRLAHIQLSALGYPPTTGLSTIDFKLLDRHISTPSDRIFYAEEALVLPTSFWCFDPMNPAAIAPQPAALRNGFITFACVGNISKITDRILSAWGVILSRVTSSRLLLRSISFNDAAAIDALRSRLAENGLPLDRVDFRPPEAGADFLASYNDIDIILDTFPFNGGTTTCFATYMGVPVVTVSGRSLISRMGRSIMTNLGASDWVGDNIAEYVEIAVTKANSISELTAFRATARIQYENSALGNGVQFAAEFEAACREALANRQLGVVTDSRSTIPPLPASEMVKRAYMVSRYGQHEAAQRIVDQCLRDYPNCGSAHILNTYSLTAEGRFYEAAEYLFEKAHTFDDEDRFAALINSARYYLLSDHLDKATTALERTREIRKPDDVARIQYALLRLCLEVRKNNLDHVSRPKEFDSKGSVSVSFLIFCDEPHTFNDLRTSVQGKVTVPEGVRIEFTQCPESRKGRSLYQSVHESTTDIVVVLNKNVRIESASFVLDLIEATEHCDLIGVAGARKWDRLDWKVSSVANKCGCVLAPSEERPDGYEIQVFGNNPRPLHSDLQVLHGSLLAFKRESVARVPELTEFDPLLEESATLVEEDFSHRAFKAGLRLGVHQGLGVVLDWRIQLIGTHIGEGRCRLSENYEFDPFFNDQEDRTIASGPALNIEHAIEIQRELMSGNLYDFSLPT